MNGKDASKKTVIKYKKKLERMLGDEFGNFLKQMRRFFLQEITKEELLQELYTTMSTEALDCYNDLFGSLQDRIFRIMPPLYAPADFAQTPKPSEAKKPGKAVIDPETKLAFMRANPYCYLPTRVEANPNLVGDMPLSMTEKTMPDFSSVYGSLITMCWQEGLDMMDADVAQLLILACEGKIKAVIASVINRKKPFTFHDSIHKQDFPTATADRSVSRKRIFETMNSRSSSSCCTSRRSGHLTQPITAWDLYEAIKVRRSLFPCYEVQILALERSLAAVRYPELDPKFKKIQDDDDDEEDLDPLDLLT